MTSRGHPTEDCLPGLWKICLPHPEEAPPSRAARHARGKTRYRLRVDSTDVADNEKEDDEPPKGARRQNSGWTGPAPPHGTFPFNDAGHLHLRTTKEQQKKHTQAATLVYPLLLVAQNFLINCAIYSMKFPGALQLMCAHRPEQNLFLIQEIIRTHTPNTIARNTFGYE